MTKKRVGKQEHQRRSAAARLAWQRRADAVAEPVVEAAQKPPRHVMTAVERRDWLRRQAGWPALRQKQNAGGTN